MRENEMTKQISAKAVRRNEAYQARTLKSAEMLRRNLAVQGIFYGGD
jgi:hypothetical protein